MTLNSETLSLLSEMGVTLTAGAMPACSPISGEGLAQLAEHSPAQALSLIHI